MENSFRLWVENREAEIVLSEPNTVNLWGKEQEVGENVYKGQFGTLRYLFRDNDGNIVAGLLIGKKGKKWQLLLIHTLESHRRRGIMRHLYQRATQDVGDILPASSYTPLGSAFMNSIKP